MCVPSFKTMVVMCVWGRGGVWVQGTGDRVQGVGYTTPPSAVLVSSRVEEQTNKEFKTLVKAF